MDSTGDKLSPAMTAALAAYGLVFFVVAILFFVLTIVVYWRIASKAGYNGALSLLMLVPGINLVMLLIFAFGEWPIETRLKGLMGGAPMMGASPMVGMGGPPIGGPPATI